MKKKYCSSLLIYCAFLSQGMANLLNEYIEESSDLHIRQKRVIIQDKKGSPLPNPVRIESAPYIVNIQKNNVSDCAGSILSSVFVLALRACLLPFFIETYTILSGSAMRNSGTHHTIRRRIVVQPNKNLVLLEVFPHFDFHKSPNRPISLFAGVVPNIAYGVFSGWGCTKPGTLLHEPEYPEVLMQTRLPIISLAECNRIYQGRTEISDKLICTLDTTFRRGTCIGDSGGPLALKVPPLMVPQLIGVSYFRGVKFGKYADLFINLNHREITEWITHVINSHALK